MGLLDFRQILSLFALDTPQAKLKDPMNDPILNSAAFTFYTNKMKRSQDRVNKYKSYERADEYELISSALDLVAEDVAPLDAEHNKTVWVESPNADVIRVAHSLFERVCMEEIITGIARKMILYGDNFEAVTFDSENGSIIHLTSPHPAQISRVQEHGRLLGFNAGPSSEQLDKDGLVKWKPWEIIHFRMPSRYRDTLYGDSYLMPAISVWEQLKMMTDAMVVYRLQKVPDRMVFYVDCGTASGDEAYDIVNRWKKAIKKREYLDTTNGDMKTSWNPLASDVDIFFPTREGSASRVEKLQGSSNPTEVVDVEYLRNNLFGALRIPKAFMGFDDNVAGGGLTGDSPLTTQSVRFAATVKNVRKSLITGIRRLVAIQMVYKRLDPRDDRNRFDVCMAPISYLDDLMRSKIYQLRTQMTNDAITMGLNMGQVLNTQRWISWALRRFFRLTEDEIELFINNLPNDIQGPDQVGGDSAKLVQLIQSNPKNLNNLLESYLNFSLKQEMGHSSRSDHYPDNWEQLPLPPMPGEQL